MIDFWIFPLSTIWGAYHFTDFSSFSAIINARILMKSNRSFCSFLTDFKHKEVKSMYKPIDASTLVLFRKRISAEMLIEANEYLLDHKDDDKDDP